MVDQLPERACFVGDVHEALLLQKLLAPDAREPLRFRGHRVFP
jgi:hypothetical protein